MTETPPFSQATPTSEEHDDWVTQCVAAAAATVPVNHAVARIIGAQLAGEAAARRLKPAEIATVAGHIVATLRTKTAEEHSV